MSFSKMPVSKRIIFGYAIFFVVLVIISVFIMFQNINSLSTAEVLSTNGDASDYTNKALNNFLNARVEARIMMLSDDYSTDVYTSMKKQLDDSIILLNDSIKLAQDYKMTQQVQILNNAISLVNKYSDTATLLNEANIKRKENKGKLPALGGQVMTAIDNLMAEEKELFRNALSSQIGLTDTYDDLNAVTEMEFEFFNARILSTKLTYLNDITAYESIMSSVDTVRASLNSYIASLPASQRSNANAVLSAIDTYSAAFVLHRDLLQQTIDYTNLCISTNVDVQAALVNANNIASKSLTDAIDSILSNSKSSLAIVSILLVISLVVNIFLAIAIVKSINRALKTSIEKLQLAAHNITASSSDLTNAANNLAQGSSEQAASIEETSATMNETTSMIGQNTQNTRQAVELAKATDISATAGVVQAENMIVSMKKLNSSSDQINKIISTINAIASQTTILALNASVEAVRAGEAGKSFSVVAEEVRNLAQQSTLAVESTTAIIRENIELTRQGMESSKEVGDSLNDIHINAEKVSQLLDEISTASEEQTRGADQINIAISQMEKVTQSTASVSEESAAAANELYSQATMLEEITVGIQKLVQG